MKHIFMGKVQYIKYTVAYDFKCSDIDYFYGIDYGYERFKNKYIIYTTNNIPSNINNIIIFPYPYPMVIKEENNIISETNNIEERLHEGDKVKINDKEWFIEKVVQCDNGDVVCYINDVIEKIEDMESKNNAEKIINEIYKRKNEIREAENKIEQENDKKN
jgi:hypothetical protein